MEFRRVCTVRPEVNGKYFVTDTGMLLKQLVNFVVVNKKDGELEAMGVRRKVKEDLETMSGVFKNVRYNNIDLILLADGTLLRQIFGYVNKDGHIKITLINTRNEKCYDYLHRLIYNVFQGPIANNMIIHHIDHSEINNRITNLIAMDNADHVTYHKNLNANHIIKAAKILKKYNV